MGGASTDRVLRVGIASILLLVSRLNDLTMWLMYAWPGGQRPEIFSWASHVAVFLGHAPDLPEMLTFLGIHLVLAALVMTVRLPF